MDCLLSLIGWMISLMARFDVFQVSDSKDWLVLDVQANDVDAIGTRVVIPLIVFEQYQSKIIPRLMPIVRIDGSQYVMLTQNISSVLPSTLIKKLTNIESDHRYDITAAMDFLFQGF